MKCNVSQTNRTFTSIQLPLVERTQWRVRAVELRSLAVCHRNEIITLIINDFLRSFID